MTLVNLVQDLGGVAEAGLATAAVDVVALPEEADAEAERLCVEGSAPTPETAGSKAQERLGRDRNHGMQPWRRRFAIVITGTFMSLGAGGEPDRHP